MYNFAGLNYLSRHIDEIRRQRGALAEAQQNAEYAYQAYRTCVQLGEGVKAAHDALLLAQDEVDDAWRAIAWAEDELELEEYRQTMLESFQPSHKSVNREKCAALDCTRNAAWDYKTYCLKHLDDEPDGDNVRGCPGYRVDYSKGRYLNHCAWKKSGPTKRSRRKSFRRTVKQAVQRGDYYVSPAPLVTEHTIYG